MPDPGRRRVSLPERTPAAVAFEHPAFAPFARWLSVRRRPVLPDLALLNRWARAAPLRLPAGPALSFVPPPSALHALDYERRIVATGQIVTRPGNLHDVCNALAWLAFPRTKAALNAMHVAAGRANTGNGRDRRRDAATLLDESGILVACTDEDILRPWAARRWREAFGDRGSAAAVRLCAVAIGHGLLAKLVAPFRQITGKALVLPVDAATLRVQGAALATALDAAAAAQIEARGAAFAPEDLRPLPVAALPGWDREGLGERLFDDASVFRPGVLRSGAR